MGGAERKNFKIFRELCGDKTLENVIIATTFWDTITPEVGDARQYEMSWNPNFYRSAIDRGAHFDRHDGTLESAHHLIAELVGFAPRALLIQEEMVDEGKSISETAAGAFIQDELTRDADAAEDRLDSLNEQMANAGVANGKYDVEIENLKKALEQTRGELEKIQLESKKLLETPSAAKPGSGERMRQIVRAMMRKETKLWETAQGSDSKKTLPVEVPEVVNGGYSRSVGSSMPQISPLNIRKRGSGSTTGSRTSTPNLLSTTAGSSVPPPPPPKSPAEIVLSLAIRSNKRFLDQEYYVPTFLRAR